MIQLIKYLQLFKENQNTVKLEEKKILDFKIDFKNLKITH